MTVSWQLSLLGVADAGFDASFRTAERHDLGHGAWLDLVPGWASGHDELFEQALEAASWSTHERPMYDRMVVEPRLTTRRWVDPPAPFPAMAGALSARYGFDLSTVSANLYRNGHDSVAWHGDRVGRTRQSTVVAILSLGSSRRFLLRSAAGGPSRRFVPASGDLLVLGGTCQRTWQHCIPKCSAAGARISVTFRESY